MFKKKIQKDGSVNEEFIHRELETKAHILGLQVVFGHFWLL